MIEETDIVAEAVEENSDGRLLDLDTVRYWIYSEVGVTDLENNEGALGYFATVELVSALLTDLESEDAWEPATYVIGSEESLKLIINQLTTALNHIQGQAAQESKVI